MAKKVKEREKPKEIIELEEVYGLSYKNYSVDEFQDGYRSNASYAVNEEGKIVGLSMFNCDIKDLKPISKLVDLEILVLISNPITEIASMMPKPHLRILSIGGCLVNDLKPLLKSKQLQELAIWECPIEDLSVINSFTNLRTLDCSGINLFDLHLIHKLKNLLDLDADYNSIIDLNSLQDLKDLQYANLCENFIKEVPVEIAKRFNWLDNRHNSNSETNKFPLLFLEDNPLTFPPFSVIELGPETVKTYYETSEQYGHAPLSEGRILFVGDGSSGKSSIIEKVLYNTFQKGREQTNGIKQDHLHLNHPEDNRELVFHIWDFGGQEIQHAVHKFFFTEGCLYVLVLDNRKEEEPEYWLQQIESLGGKAPVMVVFNKQDENAAETVDRKYLKEKYPNIVGYYNTSCSTGFGMDDFKRDMEKFAIQLRTVEEQFPKNWFAIKKAISSCTSGKQHYLNYDSYKEICRQNNVESEQIQKLLLRYFTTIGAVTWFGDTYLNFLHILSPAWITQGVYKIITAKKTAHLFGQINIGDFKELLQPESKMDYTYDENHYGYILSMMRKFDLCYSPDDITLLIPSAFGKAPKLEYSDFKGENVRTYILQFKDYMPLALIHRYIALKIPEAFENNYWHTGIVTKDPLTDTLAMVHADKEAKRIYARIKGNSQLGMWEHIRRQFKQISSSYANIQYQELVTLDETTDNTVAYGDLVSYLQSNKPVYFHPKLKTDYNVGYLMGLFQSKDESIQKIEKGEIALGDMHRIKEQTKLPPFIINILNNNSPTVNTTLNNQITIDIDIKVVNNLSSEVKGDANYLLEALGDANKVLSENLNKIIQFAEDAGNARSSNEVKAKGWGRKLKNVVQSLGNAGAELKNIQDGKEALQSLLKGTWELAHQFNLKDIIESMRNLFS